MIKIAIANQKGGVGKTTTALNLGAGLAKLKKNVLLIDLDRQGTLTQQLDIEQESKATLFDVLTGRYSVNSAIVKDIRPGLDIIPASRQLKAFEAEYAKKPNAKAILKNCLQGVNGYDYIVIDCPPRSGLLMDNALYWAEKVYLPLQPNDAAITAINSFLADIKEAKKDNKKLNIGGVLVTCFDARTRLHKAVVEQVKSYFKDQAFKTVIRRSIAFEYAPGFKQTIFEYDPNGNGTKDYTGLVKEIIKREEKRS